MNILEVKDLSVEGIKTIKYKHFTDERGYFTETVRRRDIEKALSLPWAPKFEQCNESFSRAYTVRGLHFQWSPYMGKLVRVISGNMVDLALDIRKGSETCGKMLMYALGSHPTNETNTWIWVPPGFAHGCVFFCDTVIEYMCTGFWSPSTEASIYPGAHDIDWSLCDESLSSVVRNIIRSTHLISKKDEEAHTLEGWFNDERSDQFIYGEV